MKQITAKISSVIIDRVTLDIKCQTSDRIRLAQKNESKICSPKRVEDNSLLILLTTDVSNNEGDSFVAHFETTYEFQLDDTPDNYLDYGKSECLPMALDEQSKMIDRVFAGLGYTPTQNEK